MVTYKNWWRQIKQWETNAKGLKENRMEAECEWNHKVPGKKISESGSSLLPTMGIITRYLTIGHLGPWSKGDRLIFNLMVSFNMQWLSSQITFVGYYLIAIMVKMFSMGLPWVFWLTFPVLPLGWGLKWMIAERLLEDLALVRNCWAGPPQLGTEAQPVSRGFQREGFQPSWKPKHRFESTKLCDFHLPQLMHLSKTVWNPPYTLL